MVVKSSLTSAEKPVCLRRGSRARRRGLAPLELVLWLPVLLFVVALIVNYATMATWRLRGEIVSHDAAFRARWGRAGDSEGRLLGEWPRDATIGVAPDPPIQQLDDPFIQHPVVRGPLPNGFVVRPILDPDLEGAYRGVSSVARDFPLMPRLGDYVSGEISGSILDRRWTNSEMGIPNVFRRILVLYQLPKTDPQYPRAFRNSFEALLNIRHFEALVVLDRDADIRRFTGRYHDFHPTVGRMCELDREVVRDRQVNRLVDTRDAQRRIILGQISRLPRTMTQYFLRMYRAALRWMQNRIRQLQAELQGPPPPSAQRRAEILREIADLQAEIARIRPKIGQLEAYEIRLPQIEAGLQARAQAAIP
jgi:hypothetical protein